jgi:hypothetical protein
LGAGHTSKVTCSKTTNNKARSLFKAHVCKYIF